MTRRGVGRAYQKDLQKGTFQDADYDDRKRGDEVDYGLYPGDMFRPNAPILIDSARAEQILTDNYLNKRFKQRKLEEVQVEEYDELYIPAEIVRAVKGLPLKSKKRRRQGRGGENSLSRGLGALERLEQNGGVGGADGGNEDRDDVVGGGSEEEAGEEEAGEVEEEHDDDYGVDYYASDGGDDDGGNDDPYF